MFSLTKDAFRPLRLEELPEDGALHADPRGDVPVVGEAVALGAAELDLGPHGNGRILS